jgi:hypothetical protein
MLDAYDRAREKAKADRVETFHGVAAESEFRKWLLSFLPKRYGVTAGYVVSAGLKSTEKCPHFDVIIYDQLESPVLWVKDSPDQSKQGQSLAIPVEYVRCVLEVKASLSSSTMREAIEHLQELKPLMGLDSPGERYKLYLPATFHCGVVFFELRSENRFSEKALPNLLEGANLRGFFGGVVLRGEAHSDALTTGRVSLVFYNAPSTGFGKDLLGAPMTNSVEIRENFHVAALLMWSKMGFSQFAFDLIAMMQGTYEPGFVSSWYGLVGVDENLTSS